jgi:hypothetical protein
MLGNELTTIQITKGASKLLGDIAEYFRRSKTGQIEWWIENEHRRIFLDGEREPVPAESIPVEEQP